jgi:isopenicillin N synthase-like dioxygenase
MALRRDGATGTQVAVDRSVRARDAFLPVVDLDPHRPAGDITADLAESVSRAGYILAVNHGVDARSTADMYATTRRFFAQSERSKRLVCAQPPSRFRGFAGAGTTSGEAPADPRETFAVSRFDTPADMVARGYNIDDTTDHPVNLWPREPEGLRTAWRTYLDEMERLALRLMRLVSAGFGAIEGWVDQHFDRHASGMIANFYPAQPAPPARGRLRHGEHTDFGALTILFQDNDVGGLQVRDRDGRWSDVPHRPGSLVVTLGDLVERWSAGTWPATPHRVVAPPPAAGDSERISIAYFFHPNRDALIEPIDVRDGGPPPVRSRDWIRHRERTSAQ